MSYRLSNLTVGNFLVIYTPTSDSKMSETLAVVANTRPVTDDGGETVYDLVGVERSSYGSFAWASRSVTTGQDLKFSPLSKAEADLWLTGHKIAENFATALQTARSGLASAELRCENFARYFLGECPAALEGKAA